MESVTTTTGIHLDHLLRRKDEPKGEEERFQTLHDMKSMNRFSME
jgi:hypothetical protein